MRLIGAMLLVCVSSVTAMAGEFTSAEDPYFAIRSVRVQEIPDADDAGFIHDYQVIFLPAPTFPAPALPVPGANPGNNPGGSQKITLDEIVNAAKSIWKVIQDNKPVVNVKMDHANALPEGAGTWTRLGYWKAPQSRTFRITYENMYGMNVVDFSYRVIFTYGGKMNGKGQYIANAAVVPASLDVAWGFTFNANAEASAIMNAGSPEDPLAAMQMDLHWSIDTPVKHHEKTENYYLRGDGYFEQLP